MGKRRWTLVLVPDGAEGSKSFRVSLRSIRLLGGIIAFAVVAALVTGFSVASKALDLSRLERLERNNDALAEEIARAQETVTALQDTVTAIAERDQKIRLLAGLDPIDPDVQRAGIGGPVGAPTVRELVLGATATGQHAMELGTNLSELVRRASLLSESYDQVVDSLEIHKSRLERTPSIMPTTGWLTSHFTNQRFHPIYHEARPHQGIDVSAPSGTPILAAANGRVIDVRSGNGYGNMVSVDHGGGIVTRYAHCSRILVSVGQRVSRGDKIALVGRTGLATAPHLHYEVLVSGRPQDPRKYILPESITD